MNSASPFATVFLGMWVIFVIRAPVVILECHQPLIVRIVVVMEILIPVFQDPVIPLLVAVSIVSIILLVLSVSFVNQDILGMLLIKLVSYVNVMMGAQSIPLVIGIVASALVKKE